MHGFDVPALIAATVFICAADAIWFAFAWNSVYRFDELFRREPNRAVGALYVLACAIFAASVLMVFRGSSYEQAAMAGGLIGGLVFFVFNACTCYIVNHINGDYNTQWMPYTALCDFVYGSLTYTAAAVIIFAVAGP